MDISYCSKIKSNSGKKYQNKTHLKLAFLNYLLQGSSKQQDQSLIIEKRYQYVTKWSIKWSDSQLY